MSRRNLERQITLAERRSRKRTTYGQRGGEGPTGGKTAITYTGEFPTGERFTKRTFDDLGSHAVVYAFTLRSNSGKRKAGDWYPSIIKGLDEIPPFGFTDDNEHARIPVMRVEK